MNINTISNVLKTNPDLPKKIIIASAIVTAISVAILATCFFGHFIPINCYTIGGFSALGALSVASMVGYAAMHVKSKKLKVQTSNTKENEQIDLGRLSPIELRKYILNFFKKISGKGQTLQALKLHLETFTDEEQEQLANVNEQFEADSDRLKLKIKLNEQQFNLAEAGIEQLALIKAKSHLSLACTQRYMNKIISFLQSLFNPNFVLKAKNDINDTDGIIIQINPKKYKIIYFYKISSVMNSTNLIEIKFENPIEFVCSFYLAENANDEWKCENMQILPSKIVKTGDFLKHYEIFKQQIDKLFSIFNELQKLIEKINEKIRFKQELNLSDILDLKLAIKLLPLIKKSLKKIKLTLNYLKVKIQKNLPLSSIQTIEETLSQIEATISKINSIEGVKIEQFLSASRELETWLPSKASSVNFCIDKKEIEIKKIIEDINKETKFLNNIQFEKKDDLVESTVFF